MLTLPLEPTDDRANPVFKDAAGCAQWLGQLQLTNLQLAHHQLLIQIVEFNRYPMRGLERLNTLELLRETVQHVQADLAKKLIDRPLPLNESEYLTFLSIVQLWQVMGTGYQRGLQAYIAGDKQLDKQGALLCERCLVYCGLEIFEHLRTGYEFDAQIWHQLHQLYAYAEQQAFHQTEVPDPLAPQSSVNSCSNSYVKSLLACFARPAELTRWQLQQTERWLALWSGSVSVSARTSVSKGDAQPLAVDLSSRTGLQRVEALQAGDALRYLAMVPLSKLLRVKMILLQQGQTPQQVGLGELYDSQACLDLLTLLHQSWCETQQKRVGNRRSKVIHADICLGANGIYAHLTGEVFKNRNRVMDNLTRRQIETFGRPMSQVNKPDEVAIVHPLERWEIENEHILGACLRRDDKKAARVSVKQLIAMRPGNASVFMLAVIAWARVMCNGSLQIGIRHLPGLPEAMRLSASGINPATAEAPVFMLPALPALHSPASLVMPRDWFQPGRVIEVLSASKEVNWLQLGFSVEHGLDYERVSFKPVKKSLMAG